jgi:hypothetical protein
MAIKYLNTGAGHGISYEADSLAELQSMRQGYSGHLFKEGGNLYMKNTFGILVQVGSSSIPVIDFPISGSIVTFDMSSSGRVDGMQRDTVGNPGNITVVATNISPNQFIEFDWYPCGGEINFDTNFRSIGSKQVDPIRVNTIRLYSFQENDGEYKIYWEVVKVYDPDLSDQEVFVDDFDGPSISPLWQVTESGPTTFVYTTVGGRLHLDANLGDTEWTYFKSPMSNSVMGDTPISLQWYVSEVNNQAEIIFNVRLFNEDNQTLCYLYPDGSSNFRVAYYNIGSVGNNEIDESTVAPHWGDPIRLRINENGQLYVQQWDTLSWKNLANMPQPSGPFAEEIVLGKKLYARFDFRNRNSNKDEYLDYVVLAEGNYTGYKPTALAY